MEAHLSNNYPDEPPIIHLVDKEGLDDEKLKNLSKEIKVKLKELLIDKIDVLYNLTVFIEEWLLQNNKKMIVSMHDIMLENQKLRESGSSLTESGSSRFWEAVTDDSSYSGTHREFSSSSNVEFFNKRRLQYQESQILISNSNFSLIKGVNLANQRCIFIKEYPINLESYETRKVEFLAKIVDEITKLAPLLDDENIVKYIGADYYEGKFRIYYDFSGLTLSEHFKKVKKFDEPNIKKYTNQIIDALFYLHSKGIYDIDLKMSNMLIDNMGRLKVCDYLCSRQINDLLHNNISYNEYCWPSKITKMSNADEMKKTDLHNVGLTVVELATGQRYDEHLPSIYSEEASSFVELCLSNSVTLKKLRNHEFLSHESTSTAGANFIPLSPDQSMEPSITPFGSFSNEFEIENLGASSGSRYKDDFEEISLIGEGGFGKVFKARNRLDGTIYAIKKIKFGRSDPVFLNKILREVATLSSLHHQHVVRYYQTWIGYEDEDDDDDVTQKDEFEEEDEETEDSGDIFKNQFIDDSNNNERIEDDTWADDDFEPHDFGFDEKAKRKKKILYIQMEYCTEKNLAKLIKERLLDEDYAWKLFRQIIEGLNHIHSKGFIHRDLKPMNILIDSDGNIKIGDFGLAVANRHNNLDEYNETTNNTYDMTTGIGTHFYLAPEQRSERNYDQKVDIYSLGITFFEMFYFFSTEMERHEVLMKLREGIIPPKFPKQHRELLASLIAKDPEMRPTTTDLLSSVLRLEEDILKEAMNQFTKPNTTMFSILMDKLFSTDSDEQMNFIYDIDYLPSNLEIKTERNILKKLEDIFLKNGAQYLETPLFFPKSKLKQSSHSISVLDYGGSILNIPYDLTMPFVYYIVKKNIGLMRRYVCDKVFKKESGKPNITAEKVVNFDIVGPPSTKTVIIAETLKILLEFSSQIASVKRASVIINNYRILDYVIAKISKNPVVQKNIRSVLRRSRTRQWKYIYNNLLSLEKVTSQNIAESKLHELYQLNSLSFSDAIDKIRMLHPNKDIQAATDMMKEVLKYSKLYGISEKLSFDITLLMKHKYCSDFAYQLNVEGRNIAYGFCYDKLIQKVKVSMKEMNKGSREQVKEMCGVGFNVDLKKLVHILIDFQYGPILKTIKPRSRPIDGHVDALVYSDKPRYIEARVTLVQQLRASKIRAEYIYDEKMSMDKLMNECKENGIKWFLHIKADKKKNSLRNVKIKNLENRSEDTVEFDRVAEYILNKISLPVSKKMWNIKIDKLEGKNNESQNNLIMKCFIDIAKPVLNYFDPSMELKIVASNLPPEYIKLCIRGLTEYDVPSHDKTLDIKYRNSFEKLKDYILRSKSMIPFLFIYSTYGNSYFFLKLEDIKVGY